MARKSKYTPETVAKIMQAVKMGATYELAAGYAGIDYSTFARWQNTKSEFCDALKNAEGVGAMVWLAKIEQAASDGNWQAAAWKLERRYPHMYGKTVQQTEHSGVVKLDVKHGINPADDPELAALARAYAARASSGGSHTGDVRVGDEP